VTKSVLVLSDRAVNACQSAAPTVGMQSSPCPWHPAYSHKGDVPFMNGHATYPNMFFATYAPAMIINTHRGGSASQCPKRSQRSCLHVRMCTAQSAAAASQLAAHSNVAGRFSTAASKSCTGAKH
jgi:hypothetical protein